MTTASTRTIPLIETDSAGVAAVLEAAPEQLADIIAVARRRYTPIGMRIGDALSRHWLVRAENPYLDEIESIANHVGESGVFLLNLSYEWTCTSAVGADPAYDGNRLLRTLDWPLAGLVRNVVVAHQYAEAGDYYNVTWPGFSVS